MFWPRAGLLGLFSREKKTRVKNWKLKVTKYKKTSKNTKGYITILLNHFKIFRKIINGRLELHVKQALY
jgi:hypothetical protein